MSRRTGRKAHSPLVHPWGWRRDVIKAYALAGLAAVLPGCVGPSAAWRGQVEWPNDYSGKNIAPLMEAGAALAAAAAIREMIKTNPHPHLFQGCSSPEQGLEVAIYNGPTSGLYYVMLEERFDRCGGPRYRVLDWWHVYAVTPQGEVVAAAPQPQWTWEDAEAAPLPKEAGEAPAPPPPPTPSSLPESEAQPVPPASPPPTPAPPEASTPVQD